MCIRLPAFVFALPDLWWRLKPLKILFSIFLVDPGDCVNQGLSANQNLGSGITWGLRERTDDMDLISHGSWLFDLIDQSRPLPFLDPVFALWLNYAIVLFWKSLSLPHQLQETGPWQIVEALPGFTFFVFYLIIYFTYFRPPLSVYVWTGVNFERVWIMEAAKGSEWRS